MPEVLTTRPKSRYGLLTALMTLVLAAAVGAAAWIVYDRSEPVRAGEELMKHIRRECLARLLGEDRTVCYVMTLQSAQSQRIGWSVETHRKSADGFAGVTTRRILVRGATSLSEEIWYLNADATEGEYRSEVDGEVNTRIHLSKGRVSVIHDEENSRASASAPAPDNYVPEGLLPWVLGQAAAKHKTFSLNMLVDSESIVGNQVHFTPLSVKPLGKGVLQTSQQSATARMKQTFHFDESGRITQTESSTALRGGEVRTSLTICEPQQLLQLFPNDEALREKLREAAPESAKKKKFLDRWRF